MSGSILPSTAANASRLKRYSFWNSNSVRLLVRCAKRNFLGYGRRRLCGSCNSSTKSMALTAATAISAIVLGAASTSQAARRAPFCSLRLPDIFGIQRRRVRAAGSGAGRAQPAEPAPKIHARTHEVRTLSAQRYRYY